MANVASTVVSIGLAAWLSFGVLAHLVDRLVCVSAGLLLAVALTHLLPEALAVGMPNVRLGWVLLIGILGFFLLEKLSLIHHTHPHEGDGGHGHPHDHGRVVGETGRGGLTILLGDAFHNFADGMVIAAAFLVDLHAGMLATLAVFAHEIPHEIGDFMILLNAGFARRRAFAFMLMSGAAAMAGGVAGFFLLAESQALLPYALVVAAASFVYIALSDLLPELMRRTSLRHSIPEVALVLLGVVLASGLTAVLDAH